MAASDQELITRACDALARAYAPYSRFRVGCALIAGGETYVGVNIENASFGLTICAERSAVASAVSAGHQQLDKVVVASETSPPVPPCGMCLQTLSEFADDAGQLEILLVNTAGERQSYQLAELLPNRFSSGPDRAD